jgi:hypothetical protein
MTEQENQKINAVGTNAIANKKIVLDTDTVTVVGLSQNKAVVSCKAFEKLYPINRIFYRDTYPEES